MRQNKKNLKKNDDLSALSKKLSVGEQVRKKMYNELYGPGSAQVTVGEGGTIQGIAFKDPTASLTQQIKRSFHTVIHFCNYGRST